VEEPRQPIIQKPSTPWWLWPQVLALDAPLVAVAWQAALAKAHHLTLSWEYHAALFLATWVIYLLDRSSSKGEVQGLRHHFCHRYRAWIYGMVIPALLAAGFALAAFYLPSGIFWGALALQLVALLYLWLFALRPQTMMGSVFFSLTSVACMVLVGTYPISVAYRLMISVLIVVVMTCGVTERMSPRFRVVLGKPLLSSLLFICGVASSHHFWRLDGEPLFGTDLLLLWGLALMNLAVIAQSELASIRWDGQELHPEASLQRASLAAQVQPLGLVIVGYTGFSLFIENHGTLPPGFLAMVGISALLLLGFRAVPSRWTTDSQHALADLVLLIPSSGYLLIGH
jgi:hypothetical protein